MKIRYYPDEDTVTRAKEQDIPLLLLISYNGKEVIASSVDDSLEHHILLKQVGYNETLIDSFFRIVVDKSGADCTFVCPSGYRGITDKNHRITCFYKDGFAVIPEVILAMGYMVGINIPTRYRRHFNLLSE